ncbi:MAG: tRNA (guanosine(46)-N7)-methyltransferase TrmB [Spirochaetaceae bacterium]|jgi:tRNA (guanine-N7-)-methyltransferase|nr:tRNA (guanosine(46)-N7)-methyltransferase TrmB [Spirochaetaceae bacterium]
MEHIKSFVLRSGRMSRAQARAYEEGGVFRIPYTGVLTDFSEAFGNSKPLTVEIGFGMGSATAEIAGANPEKNYLGIEVFRAGIGRLVWEIENRALGNVRIIEHDAVEVLEKMLPPGTAEAFHIFFPDPWPKKRHHKRRLVRRPFTDLLASRLCPGGYICMVTDWEDYGNSALEELEATPGLFKPPDFAPGQNWRPRTKFEKKGLDAGRPVRELYFVRR